MQRLQAKEGSLLVTYLRTQSPQLIIRILGNTLLLLGVLLILSLQDWRVGLAFSGFVAITLFITNKFKSGWPRLRIFAQMAQPPMSSTLSCSRMGVSRRKEH